MSPTINGLCFSMSRLTPIFVLTLLGAIASSAVAQECPSKTGDCLEDHNGPGCTDLVCCEVICGLDPICCFEWDSACAAQANVLCSSLCGAAAAGNCFIPNPTPSCSIATCCESVCIIDPFCCTNNWDTNCALMASFSCEDPGGGGTCGDVSAGECNDPNGIPACSDAVCCERVCEVDPGCCNSAWDLICVGIAGTLCAETCQINPPLGTPVESEVCGGETNDPCVSGTMESISCGMQKSGRFRDSSDNDVYSLNLTDGDGDGQVRLRISFATSVSALLTVQEDSCDEPETLFTLEGDSCLGYIEIACVPEGAVRLRIAPLGEPTTCFDDPHYLLSVECIDACGEPCESDEPCLLPHTAPGCGTPECCALVCEAIPGCCDWTWDSTCATAAAELCGGPPPKNDACEDALEAFIGLTPFRQTLATQIDLPPTACIDETTVTTGDVWFRHTVTCSDDLLIGTCSVIDFNSIVEVYRGLCGNLEWVACSTETAACSYGTSLVQITGPTCGETLLIRVSGADDSSGTGDLSISCFGDGCPCVGDLNNDGSVDGADLGLFLVAWGQTNSDADLTGDGIVDGSDLGLLLAAWGSC